MAAYVMALYFIIINIMAFGIMGRDKRYAQKGRRRMPERTIFSIALIGGSLGVWLAMRAFRHKTKHFSFTVGIPILFFVNAAMAWWVIKLF